MGNVFIQGRIWNGLPDEEMAEVNEIIGPSIAVSPRKLSTSREKPEPGISTGMCVKTRRQGRIFQR